MWPAHISNTSYFNLIFSRPFSSALLTRDSLRGTVASLQNTCLTVHENESKEEESVLFKSVGRIKKLRGKIKKRDGKKETGGKKKRTKEGIVPKVHF